MLFIMNAARICLVYTSILNSCSEYITFKGELIYMYLVFITFHLLAFCIISECSNSVTDTPMQQAGFVLSTMQLLNKCDFH